MKDAFCALPLKITEKFCPKKEEEEDERVALDDYKPEEHYEECKEYKPKKRYTDGDFVCQANDEVW